MSDVNRWWNGRYFIGALPPEVIEECTTPGRDAFEFVTYWVKELDFDCPVEETREYLKSTGSWSDPGDLDNHEANKYRLLWLMCVFFREQMKQPDSEPLPFYLGE